MAGRVVRRRYLGARRRRVSKPTRKYGKRRAIRKRPYRTRRVTRFRGNRRRRHRNTYIKTLSDRHSTNITTVIDNSNGTGTLQVLILTEVDSSYPQGNPPTGPIKFANSLGNWCSDRFLQSTLGYYDSGNSYVEGDYKSLRLNRVVSTYTPMIQNVTQQPSTTATGHLSHSSDMVKLWMLPNIDIMTDDQGWSDEGQVRSINNGMLYRVPINSRRGKMFRMRWRNRDPMFRGKYINVDNFVKIWSPLKQGGSYYYDTAVMPFSTQFYNYFNKQWQTWTEQGTENNPALPCISSIDHANPKYAIRKPGFLVEVAKGQSCVFHCPISNYTKWTGITRCKKVEPPYTPAV